MRTLENTLILPHKVWKKTETLTEDFFKMNCFAETEFHITINKLLLLYGFSNESISNTLFFYVVCYSPKNCHCFLML